MVTKLSDGDFGYLHIRAMDAPSLRQFQLDLAANRTKQALVIDQRFNGGGGIDQELLAILAGRKYQYTVGRDAGFEQPRPQNFYGPMVVMQNERSGSDAEMFPAGFRALGLGKVDRRADDGRGDRHRVVHAARWIRDSHARAAACGPSTGENMENYGVPPDVLHRQHAGGFPEGSRRADREGGRSAEGGARREKDELALTRDSGLGTRDWANQGLGTGDWESDPRIPKRAQSRVPSPQSPVIASTPKPSEPPPPP